jgi:hypothetical protein
LPVLSAMTSSAHEKQPSIGIKTRKSTRATAANHGPPCAVYAWFKPFPNEIALAPGTSEVFFAPGSPGRSGFSPSQCHETLLQNRKAAYTADCPVVAAFRRCYFTSIGRVLRELPSGYLCIRSRLRTLSKFETM